MGGYFGITSKKDCVADVFFGVDYHSHLGTKRAGMAAWSESRGLQREIHKIENAPFRTKFEHVLGEMSGKAAIGCISDRDPQPLLVRSHLGKFAITVIGVINNMEELIDNYFTNCEGAHFDAMTGGEVNGAELIAAMICRSKSFVEGIQLAQNSIEGTAGIVLLLEGGKLICARDKVGRIPMLIGKNEDGYAVTFESFAYQKLGYEDEKELGPGEIVEITADSMTQLAAPGNKKRICSFLWSYFGYPTSTYEGVNVEVMRYRNGMTMARNDKELGIAKEIDYVGGVPDSGTPHAIGYANESGYHFARAFIKYTPTWSRSFMPANQTERNKVAKMKQIPVMDLIKDQKLLFVDDSIVRGTQLRETVEFLYENGAKEVHIRSACPPILYGCKFLNFSRSVSDMELISRRTIKELEGEEGFNHLDEYSDANTERGKSLRKAISEKLHFDSLEFQTLEGVIEAIGLDECELCTYCWNGKE